MAFPPYFDTTVFERFELREGDVFVSTTGKSGTTWCCNIVHQLLSNGADFNDINDVVPWIEFKGYGTQEQDLAEYAARSGVRAFKTHFAPPLLPFRKDVKYLVPMRSAADCALSMYYFLGKHAPEFCAYWGVSFDFNDLDQFLDGSYLPSRAWWEHYKAWWPLRHEPNVLMLHFRDLKEDLEGSIDRIAKFLGVEQTPEQRALAIEHCTFAWMKANETKVESGLHSRIRAILPGGMVREGACGSGERALSAEQLARIEAVSRLELSPELHEYSNNGGPLP